MPSLQRLHNHTQITDQLIRYEPILNSPIWKQQLLLSVTVVSNGALKFYYADQLMVMYTD
jgi:hypothetical protein